jgi:hypothetical protein
VVDADTMTRDELRDYCKEHSLTGYSKLLAPELRRLVKSHLQGANYRDRVTAPRTLTPEDEELVELTLYGTPQHGITKNVDWEGFPQAVALGGLWQKLIGDTIDKHRNRALWAQVHRRQRRRNARRRSRGNN